MRRRLRVVMAADAVGWSALVRRDELGAIGRMKTALAAVVRPAMERNEGRLIKLTGDGFLAEFESAHAAAVAATEMQAEIAAMAASEPEEGRLLFRVGLNIGDVVVDDDDILGDGVNVAARLEAQASPGGICVSQSVVEALRGHSDFAFNDLGERVLKNIEGAVRVWALGGAGGRVGVNATAAPGARGLARIPEFLRVHAGRPSIAILPFRNLGGPEHEHLADGLRLGIQGALVRLSGLFLVNAPVLNRYKERDVAAEAAAEELDVRHVLTGALQAVAGRVRLRLELLDSRDRRVLWAERYDRDLADIFALEDEITSEVINALNLRLVTGEATRAVVSSLKTREGREAFYRGLSALYTGTREMNAEARRFFEHVWALEGESVGVPGTIAVTHWIDFLNSWSDDRQRSHALAREWAERATEVKKNNGLGPCVLANIVVYERRHDEALALAQKGVSSRRSCPLAHGHLAKVLTFCGQADAAVERARYALALERAFPPWMMTVLAAAYRDAGDLERARLTAEFALGLDSDDIDAKLVLCSVQAAQCDADSAAAIAREIRLADPAFSLDGYLSCQPYQNREVQARLRETLSAAGLA